MLKKLLMLILISNSAFAYQESPAYDTITTYDEDGNGTTTTSPRMTGSERQKIFKEIEQLHRDGMNHLNDAHHLRCRMPDIKAQNIFDSILVDAISSCVSDKGSAAATCASCLIELKNAYCQKNQDWKYAEELVKQAERKFKKANELEEKLWFDDDAEDWI
jgi:cellobiose-specific phosphotransferase system component IIA